MAPHKVSVLGGTTTQAPAVKQGDHVLFTIPGKYSTRPGKSHQLIKIHGIVTGTSFGKVSVVRQSTGTSHQVSASNILKVYPAGTKLQIQVR